MDDDTGHDDDDGDSLQRGLASDRLNTRFLGAACGGGAGSKSGNHGFEYNLLQPGINLLWAPDDAGSLWAPNPPGQPAAANPLNRYGRPNASHAAATLLYSPNKRTLFKAGSGETWEQDAGNFGNMFEARVEGANMGWEPSDTHPDIPGFNADNLDWRCVDWRTGNMYLGRYDHVYRYDPDAKIYTSILNNARQDQIGRGPAAVHESSNKIFVVGQGDIIWELDIATGDMAHVTMSGPAAAALAYSYAGLAGDPVGDCLWFFKDDQHLYKLTRTGPAQWTATDFQLAGTPPTYCGSGIRAGVEGERPAIWQGFDFFPALKGLAWVQRADVPAWYVRLYD